MVHLANPVNACNGLSPIDIADDDTNPGTSNSPIVVVKYGSCFPITKIKYAQMAGAKLVIYVEDVSLDELPEREPIGTGKGTTALTYIFSIIILEFPVSKISIPTIMIDRHTGQKLIDYLSTGFDSAKKVSISAEF